MPGVPCAKKQEPSRSPGLSSIVYLYTRLILMLHPSSRSKIPYMYGKLSLPSLPTLQVNIPCMKHPSLLLTALAVSALLFGFDVIKPKQCIGNPHCEDCKPCPHTKDSSNCKICPSLKNKTNTPVKNNPSLI